MSASRLVITALFVITLVATVGIIALALRELGVPDALQAIAFTALGGLAGLAAPVPGRGRSQP